MARHTEVNSFLTPRARYPEMPQHHAEHVGVGNYRAGQRSAPTARPRCAARSVAGRRASRGCAGRPKECSGWPGRSATPPGRSPACDEYRPSGPSRRPLVGEPPVIGLPTSGVEIKTTSPLRGCSSPYRPRSSPTSTLAMPCWRRKISATRAASAASPSATKTCENW